MEKRRGVRRKAKEEGEGKKIGKRKREGEGREVKREGLQGEGKGRMEGERQERE